MLYPEAVYNPKFNQPPIIKPLVQDQLGLANKKTMQF